MRKVLSLSNYTAFDVFSSGFILMRLLPRSKILDVALFLHCLQIIFSLKSPSPTLKRHMDPPG